MVMALPQLDEVEGYPTRGEELEVKGEDYDLPLARTLQAIEFNPSLADKAWLDNRIEEVLAIFDLTDEQKDILRTRNLDTIKKALTAESEAAGVPKGSFIVWALVRI